MLSRTENTTLVRKKSFRIMYRNEILQPYYTISDATTKKKAIERFEEDNPNCEIYRVDTINNT